MFHLNPASQKYSCRLYRMAHPPVRKSDLTFQQFLDCCFSPGNPPKNYKLDFKEFEAVEPCLKILAEMAARVGPSRLSQSIIYLNADILEGPGSRGRPATVDAEKFISTSLKYKPVPRLSLGWTTDVTKRGAYTNDDVEKMGGLCER